MRYGFPAADLKAKAESRMVVRFQSTYIEPRLVDGGGRVHDFHGPSHANVIGD
jgi:hypothetical protein